MIKRGLRRASNVILGIMIVIVVVSGIINFMGRGKSDYVPGIGTIKIMTVLSGSMIPTFKPGDAIVGKIVNVSSLKKNDIITYHYQGSLTTHRIVDIAEKDGKRAFKTKGDNNNVEDTELLPESKVVAKYLFKIPYLGFGLAYIKNRLWVILVLVIGLILFDNLKKLRR